MMNINCSENCIHCKNGNCTLNHVSKISNLISNDYSCAYFVKKGPTKKASHRT
ncbi:hydroxymyristoyl-ACP dehydratase [Clostridium sp. MSJ-11]|uniref:Hydroxymyristoyl-ACP dehydratase n=1 Tax=Clostridium mobile TaxID=2841512 RepID=A0ABS6EJI4_9CLOT|nr:hydroxymyristoyl-ACP dehydratase [Clostridium mobile]MBU5485372.1 hydroxymyristoyl-ACP dehydratase [Clostridium mobile]